MSIAKLSPASLALVNDRIWSPSGTLGYLILLKGDLYVGNFTVDASSDELTTPTPHGLITGSRVRGNSSGFLPTLVSGSWSPSTDYYAIKISNTGLKIASSLADALAGIALEFTDEGSGTHTLSEQTLTEADPVDVLINKELNPPDYSRQVVSNVGNATAVSSYGEKAPISITYYTSSDLTFRHVLFLRDATSTIGDTTGTEPQLTTESTNVVISAGVPKVITIILRTRNAE
jgi:hypothetical protein